MKYQTEDIKAVFFVTDETKTFWEILRPNDRYGLLIQLDEAKLIVNLVALEA